MERERVSTHVLFVQLHEVPGLSPVAGPGLDKSSVVHQGGSGERLGDLGGAFLLLLFRKQLFLGCFHLAKDLNPGLPTSQVLLLQAGWKHFPGVCLFIFPL